ncbi:MAG: ArnT family glycosyltransferase, partial [Flavisolibacter sp.]
MKQSELSHYHKYTIFLILLTAACRIAAAFLLELGNDEAYYWIYSMHLQWNYFDHPPLVGLWIRMSTFNLAFISEGFIRLGSIFSCAVATWLMFKTSSTAFSERAGWYTACLFNASFYVSVTAGVYILPDSPQIVFWTLSMYMLARIVKEENSWKNWLLFGVGCGLCMMSKVHGVFLLTGLFLYVIFNKRHWLKNPRLYVSLLITMIIFLPVVIWNFQNDFITYKFHSERVSLFSTDWNMKTFFIEIFSQLFLNNPVNVILIMIALFTVSFRDSAGKIFKYIGIPLAVVLIFISLTRQTLAHWSGPAYVTLMPLAGRLLEKKYTKNFPFVLKLSM